MSVISRVGDRLGRAWRSLRPSENDTGLPSGKPTGRPTTATPEGANERVRTFAGRMNWQAIGGSFGVGEEYVPSIEQFRRDPRMRHIAVRYMLADPVVKASHLHKILSVKQLDLQVHPADPKRKTDVQAAQFVKYNLTRRINGLLPAVIWNLAHPPLADGLGVVEPVWPRPGVVEDRGRWKGKRCLADLKPKPRSAFRPQVDEFGNITGILPTHAWGLEVIDPAELVVMSWLPMFGDPQGMSDFEASYKAYLGKLSAFRLRELFLDRNVGPFLAAKTSDPDDPGLKADLAAARACGYITLDTMSELQILDLASGSAEIFESAMDSYDRQIAIGMDGSYLHLLESKQANSRGSPAQHREISELQEWDLSAFVSAVLTQQVAPMIVKENFMSAGFPLCTLADVDTQFSKARLELGSMLRNNGVETRKQEWYDVSGWEPPDENDEEGTLPGITTPGAGVGPGGQKADAPSKPPTNFQDAGDVGN